MGQEPDELRRDIERRRDELGDTIDAIGDRVSPGRIIERRRNRMTDGVRSFRDRVMGTVSAGTDTIGDVAGSVRDHVGPDAVRQQTAGSPLGAGLVAFGIGFIVAAAFPPTEPEIAAADRATDALEPAKDAAIEAARNVADDVKQGASRRRPTGQGRPPPTQPEPSSRTPSSRPPRPRRTRSTPPSADRRLDRPAVTYLQPWRRSSRRPRSADTTTCRDRRRRRFHRS